MFYFKSEKYIKLLNSKTNRKSIEINKCNYFLRFSYTFELWYMRD